MSALATDTGGYYEDEIMTQKSTRRKGKKQKKGGGVDMSARTGRGGGVEHYREYSPAPMHNMPDFMMNPFDRPTSEQLTDLHVYIVPPEYWDDQHNCAFNTVMNFTTSVGFVRVYPETRLSDLRAVLIDQVTQSGGVLPPQFVFLKSVGRALTLVKDQQENQLKVKNFLPPFAYAPELFLMTRERLMGPVKRGKPRAVPPLAQVPQHKYVPTHHAQQAAAASMTNRHGMGGGGGYMPQGYPPPSHHSQYRGGGGGGQHMGAMYGPQQTMMNMHGGGDQQAYMHGQYDPQNARGRHFAGTPAMVNPYGRQQTMGAPTIRTNYAVQGQNVQDNRVYPAQSEFYPGFGGYQPTKRVGYPMDYGPPMSASPPETAMGPQGTMYVDPVPLSIDETQMANAVPGMRVQGGDLNGGIDAESSEQNRPTTASSSESSDPRLEMSLDEREKLLAKQERDLERKKEEKERKLEEKMRQNEMQQEQALRDLEKKLSDEQRKMEESKYQMERELEEQRDKQEKAISEMKRNLERQQQQEQYKQQKEMDDMLREQEKRFNEKQRDMEKQLRDQEKDLRQKFIDEEKKLADKEREIERARMELEKQQLEREKENMQKQNFIQKAKMEMRREKQQLAKEEKEQRQNERADAISRQGKMGEEGDDSSRPGSSPPKMKFPRAKTPDLLDEFQKKLLELARIKEERKEIELVRDDLIRKAHSVQAKAAQKRAQARDNWKKQYFEEKKKTLPLEEHALKLRREVDNLNRRVITRLEKEADAQQDHNQQLSSQHKIVFMKLQYELDDTKQKIDEMQLKLLGEIKRRIQCKREIVCLHKELKQTRVTANLEPVHSPPAQDQQTDENNTT